MSDNAHRPQGVLVLKHLQHNTQVVRIREEPTHKVSVAFTVAVVVPIITEAGNVELRDDRSGEMLVVKGRAMRHASVHQHCHIRGDPRTVDDVVMMLLMDKHYGESRNT